jgi:hypothetical protein
MVFSWAEENRQMPKIVFVAHPMSGDVEGNTKKVEEILSTLHSSEIIPIFPSFTTSRYLSDSAVDRELAFTHIRQYFEKRLALR